MNRVFSILLVVSLVLGLGGSGYDIAVSPVQDGSMAALHQHHADMAGESNPDSECGDCHERHLTVSCSMSISHCSGMMGPNSIPTLALSWASSSYVASVSDVGHGIEPEASFPPPRV
jgi:hypothetical protein